MTAPGLWQKAPAVTALEWREFLPPCRPVELSAQWALPLSPRPAGNTALSRHDPRCRGSCWVISSDVYLTLRFCRARCALLYFGPQGRETSWNEDDEDLQPRGPPAVCRARASGLTGAVGQTCTCTCWDRLSEGWVLSALLSPLPGVAQLRPLQSLLGTHSDCPLAIPIPGHVAESPEA